MLLTAWCSASFDDRSGNGHWGRCPFFWPGSTSCCSSRSSHSWAYTLWCSLMSSTLSHNSSSSFSSSSLLLLWPSMQYYRTRLVIIEREREREREYVCVWYVCVCEWGFCVSMRPVCQCVPRARSTRSKDCHWQCQLPMSTPTCLNIICVCVRGCVCVCVRVHACASHHHLPGGERRKKMKRLMIFFERMGKGHCQSDHHWNCFKGCAWDTSEK